MLRPLASVVFALAPLAAGAQDDVPQFVLTIQNHRFSPTEIVVHPNMRVKLVVVNKDDTAEEFESHDLSREKIVPGKTTLAVFVGPLRPGKYVFFGDFHRDTAQGVLIVR